MKIQTLRPSWFLEHALRGSTAICLCNSISSRDIICYKYLRLNQTSRAADVIYFVRNFDMTHVYIDFRSILTDWQLTSRSLLSVFPLEETTWHFLDINIGNIDVQIRWPNFSSLFKPSTSQTHVRYFDVICTQMTSFSDTNGISLLTPLQLSSNYTCCRL
jgi:hypothetical protein